MKPCRITCHIPKGGVGKTTLAVNLAVAFGFPLLDLDPQKDATRWFLGRRTEGRPCPSLLEASTPEEVQRLLGSVEALVVDCPPGLSDQTRSALALSDLILLPTGSGQAELAALGRSLEALKPLRRARPEIQVGVVLNRAGRTGRAKGAAAALQAGAGQGHHWFGALGARVAVEEAFADYRTLVEVGGDTAYEFRKILDLIENTDSYESKIS